MKNILSLAILLLTGIFLHAQVSPIPPPPPPPPGQVDTIVSNVPAGNDTLKTPAFQFAEEMPRFPGGHDAFYKFLRDSIRYPEAEKSQGKGGTVYVEFIVEKDGSVSHVHCVKDVPDAPGLAQEAIRAFSQMPDWTPGKINGKAVRVALMQRVTFAPQTD